MNITPAICLLPASSSHKKASSHVLLPRFSAQQNAHPLLEVHKRRLQKAFEQINPAQTRVVSIGRETSKTIVIPSVYTEISRNHATIEFKFDGNAYLTNHSQNEIVIEKAKSKYTLKQYQTIPLAKGNKIDLGEGLEVTWNHEIANTRELLASKRIESQEQDHCVLPPNKQKASFRHFAIPGVMVYHRNDSGTRLYTDNEGHGYDLYKVGGSNRETQVAIGFT